MSRHEGVSCDSCLKGNFRGKRYKCLICYDYDLCATCYEAGATTTRHTTDHPMQCILTRSDFDLYYGGEAVSVEQPQSFTCPFCGKMGFTEPSLQEHVTSDHADASNEVICPVCAALPGGEPNHVTDDFVAHLTLEHRSPRDLDEPSGSRHVRRIPHPGRGMSSARARRSQMQFSSSGGLASLSPSSRESMDPITELLSQLSGVRRTNLTQPNTASQLQQLHMQLQLERQQAQARQQLERLPRRQVQSGSNLNGNNSGSASALSSSGISIPTSSVPQSHYAVILEPSPSLAVSAAASQFLLSRCTEPTLNESEQQALDVERADRSMFIQELLLSTLAGELSLDEPEGVHNLKGGSNTEDSLVADQPLLNSLSPSKGDSSLLCSCMGQLDTPSSTSNPTSVQDPHLMQNARNNPTRRQQNVNAASSSVSSSSAAGRSGVRNSIGCALGPQAQPQRDGGLSNASTTRGNPSAPSQRHVSRDGQGGNRVTNRMTNRESGTSPSSTRRKLLKHADDRNKSSEPPPPPH